MNGQDLKNNKIRSTLKNGVQTVPKLPNNCIFYKDFTEPTNLDRYRYMLYDKTGNKYKSKLNNFLYDKESGYISKDKGYSLSLDGIDDFIKIDYNIDISDFILSIEFEPSTVSNKARNVIATNMRKLPSDISSINPLHEIYGLEISLNEDLTKIYFAICDGWNLFEKEFDFDVNVKHRIALQNNKGKIRIIDNGNIIFGGETLLGRTFIVNEPLLIGAGTTLYKRFFTKMNISQIALFKNPFELDDYNDIELLYYKGSD